MLIPLFQNSNDTNAYTSRFEALCRNTKEVQFPVTVKIQINPKNRSNMKSSLAFILGLASSAASFPWLREDFSDHAKRGLEVVKKDPELVSLLQSLYKDQLQERDEFFAAMSSYTEGNEDDADSALEKRTTTNCLSHTLPDFLPSNITGLKKFPEAAYPYKDPTPSDQRGPCPGTNTISPSMVLQLLTSSQKA
jgi:hypothetical protein